MCTYGESIYYDTWKKAEKQGMKKGREKGIAEGMLRSIRSLMESMGWSAKEAMNKLQVPEEERETYEALLKQ